MFYSVAVAAVSVSLGFAVSLLVGTLVLRVITRRQKRLRWKGLLSIAFLHPHPLSGGGGERVLWAAVHATRTRFPQARIVIYGDWSTAMQNGDTSPVDAAQRKAREQFGLHVNDLTFAAVDMSDALGLIDPLQYPHFTLMLQALGGIILGHLAFLRMPCDIVLDTANCAFGMLVPKLLGARTVSYVHYPTISTDMLSTVKRRETGVHNDNVTAASSVRTAIKVVYYRLFGGVYRFASWFLDDVVANSSWTQKHLQMVWQRDVGVIFPPCRVDAVAASPDGHDASHLVSVGQFRPEKRHGEQLEILQRVIDKGVDVKLSMVGGARGDKDRARADELQRVARGKKLPVDVCVNASMQMLGAMLSRGGIGLHTMRYEHFGIGIVELMVHGLIVIAHRSGGAAEDIVQDGVNGFLADDVAEFAAVVHKVVEMSEGEREVIRKAGVQSCQRFSESFFHERFVHLLEGSVRAVLQ